VLQRKLLLGKMAYSLVDLSEIQLRPSRSFSSRALSHRFLKLSNHSHNKVERNRISDVENLQVAISLHGRYDSHYFAGPLGMYHSNNLEKILADL